MMAFLMILRTRIPMSHLSGTRLGHVIHDFRSCGTRLLVMWYTTLGHVIHLFDSCGTQYLISRYMIMYPVVQVFM